MRNFLFHIFLINRKKKKENEIDTWHERGDVSQNAYKTKRVNCILILIFCEVFAVSISYIRTWNIRHTIYYCTFLLNRNCHAMNFFFFFLFESKPKIDKFMVCLTITQSVGAFRIYDIQHSFIHLCCECWLCEMNRVTNQFFLMTFHCRTDNELSN